MSKVTTERLHELLRYDLETGLLTWKITLGWRVIAGTEAGHSDKKGHLVVGIDYKIYQVSRIIWLMETGAWPAHDIDHRDGNGENNRWSNLRQATRKQNNENRSRVSSGASGFRGVIWIRARCKWEARIEHNHRRHRLGRYDTIVDAVATRLRAERAMFTHHREISA